MTLTIRRPFTGAYWRNARQPDPAGPGHACHKSTPPGLYGSLALALVVRSFSITLNVVQIRRVQSLVYIVQGSVDN